MITLSYTDSLVVSAPTICTKEELLDRIDNLHEASRDNLPVFFAHYINSFNADIYNIQTKWYELYQQELALGQKADLTTTEVEQLASIQDQLSLLESGTYKEAVQTFDTEGRTVTTYETRYLNEGYYPWLKRYRGDLTVDEVTYPSADKANLFSLNYFAVTYSNSNVFIESDDEVHDKVRPFVLTLLKNKRNTLRDAGFIFNKVRFCADRNVQSDIMSVILQYQLGMRGDNDSYTWKIGEGVYYTFTSKNELLEFSQSLGVYVARLFAKEEELAMLVDEMTLEELKAFNVDSEFIVDDQFIKTP